MSPQRTGPDYQEDDLVEVRYPLATQGMADQADWPWRPGMIISEAAEDEWLVEVTDDTLAALDEQARSSITRRATGTLPRSGGGTGHELRPA